MSITSNCFASLETLIAAIRANVEADKCAARAFADGMKRDPVATMRNASVAFKCAGRIAAMTTLLDGIDRATHVNDVVGEARSMLVRYAADTSRSTNESDNMVDAATVAALAKFIAADPR